MSLDVLAQLCGERLIPSEIETEESSERRRARSQKITDKLISEVAQKSDGGNTSSEEMSEDSRDHMSSSAECDGVCIPASGDGLTDAELKKQLRMIRNRQSAALSRKRKADRIDGLLQRVADLEEENLLLRRRLGEEKGSPTSAPPPLESSGTAGALPREAANLLSLATSAYAAYEPKPPPPSRHFSFPLAAAVGALLPPQERLLPAVSQEFFDSAQAITAAPPRATRIESSCSDSSYV